MRLINYNYGYNNTFNCSIHGKIVVTQKEWERIEKYVLNPSVTKESFFRNILKEDTRRIVYTLTEARRIFNKATKVERVFEKIIAL